MSRIIIIIKNTIFYSIFKISPFKNTKIWQYQKCTNKNSCEEGSSIQNFLVSAYFHPQSIDEIYSYMNHWEKV